MPCNTSIGDEAVIPLEGVDITGEAAPHLKGPDGSDRVPELRRLLTTTAIALHDEDLTPGVYALTLDKDTVATLALNLPRTESDLSTFSADQMEQLLEQKGLTSFRVMRAEGNDLSVSLKELDQGVKLWKWFVIAALVFLFLEILLIRRMR